MAKNKTDFLARRANAEGITPVAIKVALVKIAAEARKAEFVMECENKNLTSWMRKY
ncbi:MAG TPA: hypothetical protein PLH48_17960 [Acinetobacter johnsonii]|nr:hypothetical protein [Acinetobacter johnsonii]